MTVRRGTGEKYVQERDSVYTEGVSTRLKKTPGYLVCTTTDERGVRRRLHDVMWEYENIDGIDKIPDGCVVHHIDWNKNNNIITNLTCISVFGHNLIHNPPKGDKNKTGYVIEIIPGGMSKVIDKSS